MEDFVSFEIAKKLKEKGFREKCFATYTPYGGIFKFNEIDTDKIASCNLIIKDFKKLYNCFEESDIDAPTISQVLKWLREKKKLHITTGYSNSSNWRYIIIHLKEYFVKEPNIWEKGFETCEQAALAGIEYVLDNLIMT